MNDEHEKRLSTEQVLNALLNEVIRARVRNRALLRVLASKATLEMSEYIDAYRAEEEESFAPLVDMLILPPETFRREHAQWLERDRVTFGYQAESYPSVQLHAKSQAEDAKPTDGSPITDRPKAKRRRSTRKVGD